MHFDLLLLWVAGILLVGWIGALLTAVVSPATARFMPWLLPRLVVMQSEYYVGNIERALQIADEKDESDVLLGTHFWNSRICIYVAAGRYRAALRCGPLGRSRFVTRRLAPDMYAIAMINRAEALFALGRWGRAKQLMGALMNTGLLGRGRFALAGGATQLAWISAATGLPDVALWWLEPIEPRWLSRDYRAETYFARAYALLLAGQLQTADHILDSAEKYLRRASSKRNALFLRARIRAGQGRVDDALSLCRAASESRYRGQGGDGLLFWGDLLRDAGRVPEAREVWALARARDPESESARFAAERLQASESSSQPATARHDEEPVS